MINLDSLDPAQAKRIVDAYYEEAGPSGENDPSGDLAIHRGAECYRAAMECQDAEVHELRVALFQAAEYLYRVGVAKGNLWGSVDLGYIYYYDRCEGRYYPDFREEPLSAESLEYAKTFDRNAASYESYLRAADYGEPQSCYKLGDLLKHGRGCARDEAAAFRWYQRAYSLGLTDEEISWGSAALRLGDCYERGIGVEVDFAEAQRWYEIAVDGLSVVVERGNWYFERSLDGARKGIQRCRQELSGEY